MMRQRRCAVDQCTFLYTGQRRVFLAKNSLLFNTTAIRGGNDTLSIYCRSGTDAIVRECTSLYSPERRVCFRNHRFCIEPLTSCQRCDISALPKFAIKSVHGCTLLMMRRSRCPAYFQKSESLMLLSHPIHAGTTEAMHPSLKGFFKFASSTRRRKESRPPALQRRR